MPTLAISDAGDGANATATVAAGGASDTNTLFKATWSGSMGTLSFTSVGSRVGNGTIAVSTGVGYWLWQLQNVTSGGTMSPVIVYQNTTDTTTSVMYRILQAVKTQIVALGLTGVSSSNVKVRWLPRQLDSTTDPLPAIYVTPAPIPLTWPHNWTGTDTLGYPVLVAALSAANQDVTSNVDRNTLWIQKISREFRFQPLDNTVAEIIHVVPESNVMINPIWFDKNVLYAAQIFRCLSRETRGN